jgi:hypothetical protein
MIMSWLKVLLTGGEGNRSRLSSALRIGSKVLELKPGRHKSLNWLHIGGQIILKGKFDFLIVLFLRAVVFFTSIPSCSCCETCRVSERSVHAVFGYG